MRLARAVRAWLLRRLAGSCAMRDTPGARGRARRRTTVSALMAWLWLTRFWYTWST
jgi:hypothetical protein